MNDGAARSNEKGYAPAIRNSRGVVLRVGARQPEGPLQIFGLHMCDLAVAHDDKFTVLLLNSLFQALLGKEYPGIYFLLHLLNLDLTHKV